MAFHFLQPFQRIFFIAWLSTLRNRHKAFTAIACLGQVFRVYNLGGFRITNARCDNEFCPLMDPLVNDFEVKMKYANPQEHAPEAERNNRVIKERV